MDDEIFARLVSIKDDGQDGSALPLKKSHIYVIGRGLSADFKILDPSIRSNHCSIDFIEGVGPRLDLSRDAIVSVNGDALDGQVILNDGDIIEIGRKKLRIDVRRLLMERAPAVPSIQEPLPLLIDMISPPRINKVTVRQKTKNRTLVASTKPRGRPALKEVKLSPVKRQLFEDQEPESKENERQRSLRTRGAKTVSFA